MPKGATSRNTVLAGGRTGDMIQTFRSSTSIPRQCPSQKSHHPIQVGGWSRKTFSGPQDFFKACSKMAYLEFHHKPVKSSRYWTNSAFTKSVVISALISVTAESSLSYPKAYTYNDNFKHWGHISSACISRSHSYIAFLWRILYASI